MYLWNVGRRFISNQISTTGLSFEEALSLRAMIITAYLASTIALFNSLNYILSPIKGAKELAWVEMVTFILFATTALLARFRFQFITLSKVLLTVTAVTSTFLSADARGSHSGEIFFYFPVLALMFILFTEKDRHWAGALMIYTFFCAGINLFGPPHTIMPKYDQNTPIDFGISFAAAGAISLIVTNHIRSKLAQSHLNLEKRTHDLVRSAQHAMVGEMAAGVAHEVNNPLSILSGKLQLMKRKIAKGQMKPEEIISEIELLEKTCDRITKIVIGLKTISRGENTIQFADVDINQVVRESVWACTEKLKSSGTELKLQLDNVPHTNSHAIKLSQVLVNLIGNSCDALSAHSGRWIEIQTCVSEGFVEIRVTDSGAGIPREAAEKIFNSFYTTKPLGQGTGLGLSISKAIMKEHGGDLILDESCKNTRFVCRLPLKQADNKPALNQAA